MRASTTMVLTILLAASSAFATAQAPDKIIYKGQEYSLLVNPMEAYFDMHPERRPRGRMSTALWRGYVATFQVRGERLVLKDIHAGAVRSALSTVVPPWNSPPHGVKSDRRAVWSPPTAAATVALFSRGMSVLVQT